jgi:hypothetical protein
MAFASTAAASPSATLLDGRPSVRIEPTRLSRINAALNHGWKRGWLSRPSLDPGVLVAKAQAKTGLANAGADRGWRGRLDLLTHALHNEAELSPIGLTIAHGQLVAALANRLRAHDLWRRHPEILDHPIRSPIIVLGQMRSGSTRMQRLLACDPGFAHTRFFESWNPVPAGTAGVPDDRRLRGWLALRCAGLLNPEFDAIHPTTVSAPDEETGLHNISIFGAAFEAQWRIPSFARAGEAMDTVPVYREFKRLLQTIAWQRHGDRARPWVLKMPQLTQDLGAVLEVFPDARLVCLERPAEVLVASSASLAHSQMRVQSDHADPRWIGREWLRKVALRERRMAETLAKASVPRVHVAFGDMERDWRGEMARVYRMLGLTLTGEVEARMLRFLERPGHRKLAGHRYALHDYGVSTSDVEAAVGAWTGVDHARSGSLHA